MSGFTKLFNSILMSSIWQEPDSVRLVWITLLAMANREGVIEASPVGLAHAARVPLEECLAALTKFEGPDEMSRSEEWGGRRIEKVAGGYRLLNYQKYRNQLSTADRREYQRVKQAEYRQQKKEATARAVLAKAVMAGKGTMAERLAEQARKKGDAETLRRLEEIRDGVKPDDGIGAALKERVRKAMEEAQKQEEQERAAAAAKVEEAETGSPAPEGGKASEPELGEAPG